MHISTSKGCCKDDVKMVKGKLDQSLAKTTAPDFSVAIVALSNHSEYFFSPRFKSQPQSPFAHGPPLSKQDTYLQNCVFRI